MYHAYIRSNYSQRIAENTKTVTRSPEQAETAFRELMQKREYWCTQNAAVLTLDNRLLEYRRFDRIVPSDPELAKRLAQGEAIPDLPRFLYPDEQSVIATKEPGSFILCYLDKEMVDAPILDDDEPINLAHRD